MYLYRCHFYFTLVFFVLFYDRLFTSTGDVWGTPKIFHRRLSRRSHVLSQVHVAQLFNVFSIYSWHTRLLLFESIKTLKSMVHFFFMLHFYNVRIVADTFANVGWTKARHSICVITQSPLHFFFFFFAHSLCYYSVTVTKEGLLYWQGVSKFTFSVPWSFCVSSLLGGTSYLRQLSFWAWGMCKWGALSPRLVTAAFVIFVMHM